MKCIVIYYSYSGNTRVVAGEICRALNADIAEIATIEPYAGSYDDVVEQGRREVGAGYMPEIREMDVDLSQYDVVVLGFPVWWYTFAPAMRTFLEGTDLRGKRVYPFATNGGWIGHSIEDVAKMCAGAQVGPGLNVRFNGNRQITKGAEIQRWIGNIPR